jgi:hypothetical protein
MYLADRTAYLMSGQPVPSFTEYYSQLTKPYIPIQQEKPQIYKTLDIIKQVEEWNKNESI